MIKTRNDESYVKVGAHGTTLVGPDAIEYARAATLAAALRLYAKAKIIPTRGVTITRMLQMAEKYTGKKYKRGAAAQAAADVDVWVNAMRAAIPVVGENGEPF